MSGIERFMEGYDEEKVKEEEIREELGYYKKRKWMDKLFYRNDWKMCKSGVWKKIEWFGSNISDGEYDILFEFRKCSDRIDRIWDIKMGKLLDEWIIDSKIELRERVNYIFMWYDGYNGWRDVDIKEDDDWKEWLKC